MVLNKLTILGQYTHLSCNIISHFLEGPRNQFLENLFVFITYLYDGAGISTKRMPIILFLLARSHKLIIFLYRIAFSPFAI